MNHTVTLNLDKIQVDVPLQQLLDQLHITARPSISNVPTIGEAWQGQGGIYAGVIRGRNGKPDSHLILAVADAAIFEDLEWGGYGTKIDGADDLWDGLANTKAILQAKGEHPAADAAAGVLIDGHDDFYLPSKGECALLYANLPEQFESGWHWTSTQVSAYDAAHQNFDNGFQSYSYKEAELRVRVVRRLTI